MISNSVPEAFVIYIVIDAAATGANNPAVLKSATYIFLFFKISFVNVRVAKINIPKIDVRVSVVKKIKKDSVNAVINSKNEYLFLNVRWVNVVIKTKEK